VSVAKTLVAERVLTERSLELHPQVALRPEPFGALLYHYGTRRLVFLKHPDLVRVVAALADCDSVDDALTMCGIPAGRRGAFVDALDRLVEADMLLDRSAR
jgi:putative mycofactocin binding protein MftB